MAHYVIILHNELMLKGCTKFCTKNSHDVYCVMLPFLKGDVQKHSPLMR